jgi:hypothetical protein
MSNPVRIQRQRTKGYRMPPNTVSVVRPGKWGNPYRVGHNATDPEAAVRLHWERFEKLAAEYPHIFDDLRGKNLACFCPLGAPCHADTLLKLANAPVCEGI